jgi:hypothetical protein
LLPEEDVFAAEDLAVDAGYYEACFFVSMKGWMERDG